MKNPIKETLKFLSGAFFVSTGVLWYLYFEKVSVPLPFGDLVETPHTSGTRAIVHFILFLTSFYLGFIRDWKIQPKDKGKHFRPLK